MRNLIIILAIIGLLFLGIVALGGNISGPDKADDFQPGGFDEFFAGLPLPFGPPKYLLADAPFVVSQASGGRLFHIPASDAPTRLVTLALDGGLGVRATYDCGEGCRTKRLCVVREGAGDPGGCDGVATTKGTLVIGKEGGTVRVEALDLASARVESR
jgi:hypothetical protein